MRQELYDFIVALVYGKSEISVEIMHRCHNEHEALGLALSNSEIQKIKNFRVVKLGESQKTEDEILNDIVFPHLQRGEKIHAIRAVREHTQWELREAKDWVDNYCFNNPEIFNQKI